MSNGLTIRHAQLADLAMIKHIDESAFGHDTYPLFFFRQAIDLWPDLLLVAEQDDQLQGYILGGYGQEQSQAWVLSLAVLPQARGQGVARNLLLTLENTLMRWNVVQIKLTLAPDNPAKKLYFSLHYQEISYELDYFGTNEHRFLLAKTLRA